PGVLVLHDMVLHHFLIDRTVHREGDHEAYRRELEACHGWVGAAAARPLRWPGGSGMAAQFSLPANRTLLAAQRGVLVHSSWAADTLREEIPGLRVRSLPMGMPLPPPADRQLGLDFRRRRGLPADRPLLGSFGFQTPMKRTEVVIRALAHPALERVHLMVAGEVAESLDLEKTARAAGVADRVHVLGFLPWEDFEPAIAAADLALNLRHPTAGETSASLLRILAVGRPAIVSDYAQSAELPDDGVIKVPPGEGEELTLAARLADLLADPEGLGSMGRAARAWIESHHRLEVAAGEVVEACASWRGLEPPQLAPARGGPPTSQARDRLEGDLRVEGAETPWAPGERRLLKVRLENRSRALWLAGERPAGGVALEARLWCGGQNLWRDRGWVGLPRDLRPGESHVFELALRRPLEADVRLELRPHVLDHALLADFGGPLWAQAL
ncbi:MAG: glycosyltransferase, partial [Acidobacteriota bacterium]